MTPNHFTIMIRDGGGFHQMDPQADMTALESLRIAQMIITARDPLAQTLMDAGDIMDFMRQHKLERHFKWVPANVQRNSWL